MAEVWGYTAHIRTRGEEAKAKERIPGYRARRWVVERTHSWLNRFRRLLIRWEKKAENYLAMLHFACAWITFRAAGVRIGSNVYLVSLDHCLNWPYNCGPNIE